MKQFYHALRPLLLGLCLLLGTTPAAHAQFLWQKAVGTAPGDETAEFMVPVPGGFVTLGKYVLPGQNRTGLFLSKVSYVGDTLWTRRCNLARSSIVYPKGLFADAAGNLVATAITLAASSRPFEGRPVKFSPVGDTLWTRAVRGTGDAHLDVPVLGNDGNYVVTGDYGPSFPALFKFSPAGALLWTQLVPYDNAHMGYLQNLVAVPSGYLLFSSANSNLRGKYIRVDEQGTFQRERLATFYGPAQLKLDSQGNVLAVGGSITKLTAQGDSLWSHSYQQYGQLLGISRLTELSNGRYLAAGERYNGPTRDVGMVVVDRNGTLLRDTLLVRYNSDENVAGVALTPAGNYVVAFGASSGPIGRADQVLFAYRNWDRLLPTRTAQAAPLAALYAYPNPTTGDVTLSATDAHPLTGQWSLYDMLGRLVQAGSLAGLPDGRVSLTQQPVGLYLIRVTDSTRHTTQTLRLQKN